MQESFIVATNPEGLWIIDQHVAHERVLFERHLRQRQEKKVEGQRLLLPIVVELQAGAAGDLSEIAEELAANGFEVEPFGQRTVAVKAAPAEIRADDVERLVLEILDGVGRRRGRCRSMSCGARLPLPSPATRRSRSTCRSTRTKWTGCCGSWQDRMPHDLPARPAHRAAVRHEGDSEGV